MMSRNLSKFVSTRALLLVLMVSITSSCKPSSVFNPKDSKQTAPSEKHSTTQSPKHTSGLFSHGQWVDEDGSTWDVSVDGMTVSATAISGYSSGLKIQGEVRRDLLHFSINTDDTKNLGKGRAMILDENHAYYVVTGDLKTHGLFHFDHASKAVSCQSWRAEGLPRDLRPPAPHNLQEEE